MLFIWSQAKTQLLIWRINSWFWPLALTEADKWAKRQTTLGSSQLKRSNFCAREPKQNKWRVWGWQPRPSSSVIADIPLLRQKNDSGQTSVLPLEPIVCVCVYVHARRISVVYTHGVQCVYVCVCQKICCLNPTRSENKPQGQQTGQ